MEHDSATKKLSYVVSVKSKFIATFRSSTSTVESKQARKAENKRLIPGALFVGLFYGFFAGLVAILFAQEGFNSITVAILAGALTAVVTVPIIHYTGDLNNLKYQFQNICTIVATTLAFVISLAAIVAAVEITTWNYARGALVGVITSVIAREFNTQVGRTLIGTAKSINYTYIHALYGALILGVLDITDFVSIMGAGIGGSVGTGMYIIAISGLVEVLPGKSRDTVAKNVSEFITICIFIGATIGVLGVANGAITGAIMGAIIAKAGGIDQLELVESFGSIHPYSIAVGVILGAIRVIITILRQITNIITVIIPRQTVTSEIIIGATFGAIIGAFAGVTGGACAGVIVAGLILGSYYCLGVTMAGEFVLLIGEHTPSVRHAVGRDAARAIDKNCCLILICIPLAVLSSMVGAYTGGYFITSALNGTFGSFVSWFTRYMAALCKIGSLAIAGGMVGTIIGSKLYHTKAVNNTPVLSFVLGIIGAVIGVINAKETFGFSLWQIFGIPIGGALGGISGAVVGYLLVCANVFAMEILANGNTGGIKTTINAMIGGFAGGMIGGYFTSNVIFVTLIGIVVSVVFADSAKRIIRIPLNDVVANFGEVVHITESSINQGGTANNNWVQHKIKCEQYEVLQDF